MYEKYQIIGEVRGLGAMAGMELVKDRVSKEPGTAEMAAVFKRCLENGLILVKAGHYNHVIRFLAPLAITDEQLAEGLDILEKAIAEVSAGGVQHAGGSL